MDELAREEWQICFDSEQPVEEYSICICLYHGSPLLGCTERNGNDYESVVSVARNWFIESSILTAFTASKKFRIYLLSRPLFASYQM